MAAIQDDSKFKIKVTPEYTNWWTFKFEFFYEDKPLFNPEISRAGAGIFEADEYDSWPFLPILEKAIEGKTGGENYGWGAWEDEVEVDITAPNPFNLGGYFDFTVSVAEHCFKNAMAHGSERVCVILLVGREELKKFYNDLKLEMAAVVHSLTPPREIEGSQPIDETKVE